ncbi:MAG: RlmE family RNA methyltransferase [Candidatus Heimdallarchaeaceae archaeon]
MSDDHYYLKAKYEGYRSRAAFKLIEINDKFKIFKKGQKVLDLGASPGGWSQVASKKIGNNGKVVAVDKAYIPPFKQNNIEILSKDIFDKTLGDFVVNNFGRMDVIISDCAPNISGDYSRDHVTQIHLAEQALELALTILNENGTFVCKLFQGSDLQKFVSQCKDNFQKSKLFKPRASRKKSAEIYLVCLNLKNKI